MFFAAAALEAVLGLFSKEYVILTELVHLEEENEMLDRRTEAPLERGQDRVGKCFTPMTQASSRGRPRIVVTRMMTI